MVDIVMLIGLPMILPARVTRCWTDDSMNPIPEEVKRRERECDGWKDRREVVPASIRTRVRVLQHNPVTAVCREERREASEKQTN